MTSTTTTGSGPGSTAEPSRPDAPAPDVPAPDLPPAPGVPVGEPRPARAGDRDGLAELDDAVEPWPGQVVDVGGRAVHVRTTPGPAGATPTVYVHGLGGSATNWTDLAGLLSPLSPGHALDLPGFGRSAPPADGDYSLPAAARVVTDYLRATGPANLVGNSMGGAISLLVAARHPELVRTLTLCAPAVPDLRPDPRRLSDSRLLLAFVPVVGKQARASLRDTSPQARAEQMVRLCYGDPTGVPEHRLAQAAQEYAERADMAWGTTALGRSFAALVQSWVTLPGRRSLWSLARTITAPTTVVWGTSDKLVNVDKAARVTSHVPRSRLLVLSGVGHVAQMERPLAVARALRSMQQAVDAGEW